MTQQVYTPGPWTTQKRRDGVRFVLGGGFQRAKVLGPLTSGQPGYDEAEANARLIAAAPDTLRELKSLVARVLDILDSDGVIDFYRAALESDLEPARAAIAKATE